MPTAPNGPNIFLFFYSNSDYVKISSYKVYPFFPIRFS